MVELPPSLAEIHAEMNRARTEFHSLVDRATHDDLQRKSEGPSGRTGNSCSQCCSAI